MKSLIKIFSTIIIAVSLSASLPPKVSAQGAAVSFQVFYDNLSPYGQWVDYPDYGYGWIPYVDANFSPYATNGYWVMTDYGWTWVSNYSWGWAPFHYGRWQYDNMYGWVWFPDTEWAPAWVVWRRAPGYYGWAPLGPRVSIDVAYGPSYRIPDDRWIFVNERDIVRPDIDRYYVNRGNNVTIIKNTTVINNVREDNSTHVKYVTGPDRSEVEKNTGAQVKVMTVAQSDRPEKTDNANGQLRIYKPAVQKTANVAQKPAPKQVVPMKEVKPVSQRSNTNGNENNNNNRVNENRPNQENNQPNDNNRPNENDMNHQNSNQNDNNRVQPEQHNQTMPTEIQREKLNQPNGSQNGNPQGSNERPVEEQRTNEQNQNNQQMNQQTQPDHTVANPDNSKAQQHTAAKRRKVQQQQPAPQEEQPAENRDTIPKH